MVGIKMVQPDRTGLKSPPPGSGRFAFNVLSFWWLGLLLSFIKQRPSAFRIKQVGLFICLLFVGCILFVTSDNAQAGDSLVVILQTSPLASPIAMALPASQVDDNAETFPQQYPIYSGSQASQTSLVLIGAVLVGLIIVGTLVITRRD